MKKFSRIMITGCFLLAVIMCIASCGPNSSTEKNTTTGAPLVSSGLIAHYNFSEGSGAVLGDSSGYNNPGTIFGASWVTGRSGNALYFNGVNNYVRVPGAGQNAPATISNLAEGTIAVWFKFSEEAGTTGIFLPIFYMGPDTTSAATSEGLIIEIGHRGLRNTSQQLFYTVTLNGNANPTLCFDSTNNLTANQWYHFVVTVSAAGNTGYLNGVEMTGRTYNFGNAAFTNFLSAVNGGMLTIGMGRSAVDQQIYYFKGTINDLRIYNKALTAAEVTQLYTQ